LSPVPELVVHIYKHLALDESPSATGEWWGRFYALLEVIQQDWFEQGRKFEHEQGEILSP
jgi:hypothetical protein